MQNNNNTYILISKDGMINLEFRITVGHARGSTFLQLDTSKRRGYITERITKIEGWLVDDREWTR